MKPSNDESCWPKYSIISSKVVSAILGETKPWNIIRDVAKSIFSCSLAFFLFVLI